MSLLRELLTFNEEFVRNKEYKRYETSNYPNKKMVILTCMDTRLLELLPKALNLKNGDAKVVKTAGALLTGPYDSTMRSILVAVALLKADEVFVIGHHDCGMTGLKGETVLKRLAERGVDCEEDDDKLEKWLTGCESVEAGVKQSVEMIRHHPLFPKTIPVHGLAIHPKTGKLDLLLEGKAKTYSE